LEAKKEKNSSKRAVVHFSERSLSQEGGVQKDRSHSIRIFLSFMKIISCGKVRDWSFLCTGTPSQLFVALGVNHKIQWLSPRVAQREYLAEQEWVWWTFLTKGYWSSLWAVSMANAR
jgi:hypothetical protein